MSIAGSGTQQDPWLITTYAELVEKASESGEYLRIENDINITDEYPDGDFPTLAIAADIEGNGKKISNWYRSNGNYGITTTDSTSQVRNLTFANIYHNPSNSSSFMSLSGYNPNYHFVSCNFRGILVNRSFMDAYEGNGSSRNFSSCSFYLKGKNVDCIISGEPYRYIGMRYCYVEASGANYVFDGNRDTIIDACYFDTTMPTRLYSYISNSVLDMTTTATFTADGSSGNSLNIINSDHAPNATAGTGFALVDNTHWTDVSYLNSIGFNAG